MSNSTNSLVSADFLLRAMAPPLCWIDSVRPSRRDPATSSGPLLRLRPNLLCRRRASRRTPAGSADQRQIAGRFLAAIAHDLVLDLLTFVEPRQTGALDRRDMDEHVLAAGIRLDEAVALLRIEPLDRTRSHDGLREIRISAPRPLRAALQLSASWSLEEHARQA